MTDIKQMTDVMNHLLNDGKGKFCFDEAVWRGTMTRTSFKKFLDLNAKNGVIIKSKDDFGQIWYYEVEA